MVLPHRPPTAPRSAGASFPWLRRALLLLWLALAGCDRSTDAALDPVPGSTGAAAEAQPPDAPSPAPPGPYDESADAGADVDAAITRAAAEGRLLLLTFGANWCTDCRAFDAAMNDPALAAVLADHFVPVKIDVGNWDKHPEVVAAWDDPIAGGIPAVVVATPAGDILYTTKAGELATARQMGPEQFAAFFERLAALAPSTNGGEVVRPDAGSAPAAGA